MTEPIDKIHSGHSAPQEKLPRPAMLRSLPLTLFHPRLREPIAREYVEHLIYGPESLLRQASLPPYFAIGLQDQYWPHRIIYHNSLGNDLNVHLYQRQTGSFKRRQMTMSAWIRYPEFKWSRGSSPGARARTSAIANHGNLSRLDKIEHEMRLSTRTYQRVRLILRLDILKFV